jgi:type II secretory pathway component PulK
MLKGLKNNQRGIVFITVLIIIIIAMVLAISTLSLNVSQVKSAEDEVRFIQAQALAEGGFGRIYMDQLADAPLDRITYTEQLGNTTFTIDAAVSRGTPGPAGSASYKAVANVTF